MAAPLQQTPSESSCTESSTDSSTEEDWESGKSSFLATKSQRLPSCSATSKFGLSSANHQSVHLVHQNLHPRRRRKSKSQKKGEREKGDALRNIQSQPVLRAALIRKMSGVWGRERENSTNRNTETERLENLQTDLNLTEKCLNLLTVPILKSQDSSLYSLPETQKSLEYFSILETENDESQESGAYCSIWDEEKSLSNEIFQDIAKYLPDLAENTKNCENKCEVVSEAQTVLENASLKGLEMLHRSETSHETFSSNPSSLENQFSSNFSNDPLEISQNPDNLSNLKVSGDKTFLNRFSAYFKRSHSHRNSNSNSDLTSQVSSADGVKANKSNSSLKEFFEHCMSPISPRVKRFNPFSFRHVRQEVDEIVRGREEKD